MTRDEITKRVELALSVFDEKSDNENFDEARAIVTLVHEEGVSDLWDAPDYSEPGYERDNEDFPVFLANWNAEGCWDHKLNKYVHTCELMPKLGELLENNGASIEWSDEWARCEDCNNAFRISPDSYGWKQFGVDHGDFVSCGNCILEDPSEYFDWLRGHSDRAVTIHGLDPTDHGYARVNSQSFENGLHGGQDASPDAIASCLRKAGIEDFLFSVDSTGQFDLRFSVFVDRVTHDGAVHALSEGKTTCDVDPKVALEQGLKAASKAMAEAHDKGVKVADVDIGTGSATVKTMTPEEFIRGK
jgi:hypothetical protein